MSKILIDHIRIDGFRGLKNFQLSLDSTTVLTGMNNVGKTSVLKALQLVFGSSSYLSVDDLHIENNVRDSQIIIDVRIVPIDDDGKRISDFSPEWQMVFKAPNIKVDAQDRSFVAFRTTFENSLGNGNFIRNTHNLIDWEQNGVDWHNLSTMTKFNVPTDQMPFFYIGAQRDIMEDMKLRNSYLGRMLDEVSSRYSKEQVAEIERLIQNLNEKAIADSDVLSRIQAELSDLDSTMDKVGSKVSVVPFTKKIRDLNKSLSIQYGSTEDTFTMDYHGMGTRSWSSLLTFKAFISLVLSSLNEGDVCCPIIAIEEPESHLHPNAQKQLYSQMSSMNGIKIISTHSPYVAASAKITELRNLYKDGEDTLVGQIDISGLHKDEIRNIERQVISSHGELLFSKAVVLFEGETEAIALPIYAEKVLGMPQFKSGVEFVGVGGYGFYAPYIRFAEAFRIPWYIFSDGEEEAKDGVLTALRKALKKPDLELADCDNVFILPDGKDYELYITGFDYLEDFKNEHKRYNESSAPDPRAVPGKNRTVDGYTMADYYEKADHNKTAWAGTMAEAIVNSANGLPPIIDSLMKKVKNELTHV